MEKGSLNIETRMEELEDVVRKWAKEGDEPWVVVFVLSHLAANIMAANGSRYSDRKKREKQEQASLEVLKLTADWTIH